MLAFVLATLVVVVAGFVPLPWLVGIESPGVAQAPEPLIVATHAPDELVRPTDGLWLAGGFGRD